MAENNKIMNILLVEDNPDDVQIAKRAFKQANLSNQLYVVRDGQEAIDFLFHKGKYQAFVQAFRPELILLDINMPKINGIDVLKEIKNNNELRSIPVIMLTVSKRDEDITMSYNYGCNSFIQKPIDFDKFVEIVKWIGFYWGILNIQYPVIV